MTVAGGLWSYFLILAVFVTSTPGSVVPGRWCGLRRPFHKIEAVATGAGKFKNVNRGRS